MPHWLELVSWTTGFVVGIGLIWRLGVKPAMRGLRNMVHVWDELSEIVPVIRWMADEFKPNGGSSLRDRVDLVQLTVGENQTALEQRIIDHDDYHENLEARIERLEDE